MGVGVGVGVGGRQDDICMVVVLEIDNFLFLKIQDAA